MGIIYIATNQINGKQYVGKTVRPLSERRVTHQLNATKGQKSAFYNALRKYGFDAFDWDVVIDDVPDDDLNSLEIENIKWFDSKAPNGYNLTDGGDGLNNPTQETRDKIGLANKNRPPEVIEKMRMAQLGKKASLETRAKMSLKRKGKKLNCVRIVSVETRAKISQSNMGHPTSDETRAKIGKAKLGQMHTAETRAKMSASQQGKVMPESAKIAIGNYWRGRKRSESNREKLRLANIGKTHSPETRIKIGLAGKGRKHTDETKAKMSAAHEGHPTSAETRTKISQSLTANRSANLKAAAARNADKRIAALQRHNLWRQWDTCCA